MMILAFSSRRRSDPSGRNLVSWMPSTASSAMDKRPGSSSWGMPKAAIIAGGLPFLAGKKPNVVGRAHAMPRRRRYVSPIVPAIGWRIDHSHRALSNRSAS
jgi:hypothetical protein